jgi:hypothetical protein
MNKSIEIEWRKGEGGEGSGKTTDRPPQKKPLEFAEENGVSDLM